jgi:hypothetical protein
MPTFKFKSPDGKSYSVNGPEGSTSEQAFEILQQQIGKQTPSQPATPAQPQEPQDNSTFAQNVLGGAIRGIGSIGATAMAGAKTAAEAIGIKNDIIPYAERAKAMDAGLQSMLGVNPESMAYKGSKMAAEVGATLPVGGAIAAPVKAVATMAPSLARFLTPLATAIETGGFAGKAAGLRTKTIGGAITGAAGSAMINPEDAEIGAIIGGALPGIGKIAGKSVDFVQKIKDLKSNTLLEAAGDKGQAIIDALRDPFRVIVPGSAPTAGEVAAGVGSTGYSALQKQGSELKQTADKYAAASAQTNQARLAQDARVAKIHQDQINNITQRIDSNVSNVSPGETGQNLINIANASKTAIQKGVIEPAYNQAFQAAGKTTTDISNVVDAAEKILGRTLSSFSPETAPALVRKLMGFVQKAPIPEAPSIGAKGFKTAKPLATEALVPQATLEELDAVRKSINADIAQAKAGTSPLDPTTVRNLSLLHKEIDKAIGKSTTLPDAAKGLYADAVGLYRTEYAPLFKEGVNAKLFRKTNLNEGRVKPEDVVNTYFTPNGESEAKNFITLFGKNPDAVKIASSGIEDVYRKKVVEGGMSHANFMKEYGRTIDIFDQAGMGLRDKFSNIGADYERIGKLTQQAKESVNNLKPALPEGANALAIEANIANMTQGLNPAQLTKIDAVRKDLARELEYQRLARAGSHENIEGIASDVGKKTGLAPTSALLSRPITIYNKVVKSLLGVVDDKLAAELATEMLNPTLAANALETAMKKQAANKVSKEKMNRLAANVGRVAPVSINSLTGNNK